MTLNQEYTPHLPTSPPYSGIQSRESEEVLVTTAQQNAATLLYLKNRQEIWSTDKSALRGSAYSERLEKIEKGDERLCEVTPEREDLDVFPPSLAAYMGLGSSIGLRLSGIIKFPPSMGSDPVRESLYQYESQVNEASQVLNRVNLKQNRSHVIPALESAFDKLDDVKILLEALDVGSPLAGLKSKILARADQASIAIEKAAQDFNS